MRRHLNLVLTVLLVFCAIGLLVISVDTLRGLTGAVITAYDPLNGRTVLQNGVSLNLLPFRSLFTDIPATVLEFERRPIAGNFVVQTNGSGFSIFINKNGSNTPASLLYDVQGEISGRTGTQALNYRTAATPVNRCMLMLTSGRCTDLDGMNVLIRGVAGAGGIGISQDTCVDPTGSVTRCSGSGCTVSESYCYNDVVRTTRYNCANCTDGICLPENRASYLRLEKIKVIRTIPSDGVLELTSLTGYTVKGNEEIMISAVIRNAGNSTVNRTVNVAGSWTNQTGGVIATLAGQFKIDILPGQVLDQDVYGKLTVQTSFSYDTNETLNMSINDTYAIFDNRYVNSVALFTVKPGSACSATVSVNDTFHKGIVYGPDAIGEDVCCLYPNCSDYNASYSSSSGPYLFKTYCGVDGPANKIVQCQGQCQNGACVRPAKAINEACDLNNTCADGLECRLSPNEYFVNTTTTANSVVDYPYPDENATLYQNFTLNYNASGMSVQADVLPPSTVVASVPGKSVTFKTMYGTENCRCIGTSDCAGGVTNPCVPSARNCNCQQELRLSTGNQANVSIQSMTGSFVLRPLQDLDKKVDMVCAGQYPCKVALSLTPLGNNVLLTAVNVTDGISCADGTLVGRCSLTQPNLCVAANTPMVLNCSVCGCANGGTCLSNGACQVTACSDGTLAGQCSTNKPMKCQQLVGCALGSTCTSGVSLVSDCATCGCGDRQTCYNNQCVPEMLDVNFANIPSQVIRNSNYTWGGVGNLFLPRYDYTWVPEKIELYGTNNTLSNLAYKMRMVNSNLINDIILEPKGYAIGIYVANGAYYPAMISQSFYINSSMPTGNYTLGFYNLTSNIDLFTKNTTFELIDFNLSNYASINPASGINIRNFEMKSVTGPGNSGKIGNQFGVWYYNTSNPGPIPMITMYTTWGNASVTTYSKDPTRWTTYMISDEDEGRTVKEINGNKVYVSTIPRITVVGIGATQRSNTEMGYSWISGDKYVFVGSSLSPSGEYNNVSALLDWYLAKYPSSLIEGQENYIVTFQKGWNLISLPLIPNNKNISYLVSGVRDKIGKIYDYDPAVNGWKIFNGDPSMPSNLDTLQEGRGYYLYAKDAGSFSVIGSRGIALRGQPEIPPTFRLTQGWNLVSLHNKNPTNAKDAFRSILPSLNSLWTLDNGGLVKLSTTDANLSSGQGYWVNLAKNDTLVS